MKHPSGSTRLPYAPPASSGSLAARQALFNNGEAIQADGLKRAPVHFGYRPLQLALITLLMVASASLDAQQLSLFTQYRENATLLNPAALDADYLTFGYNMGGGINYRRQWAGLDDAPETQSVRFSYINPYNSGVNWHAGGYVLNDQTGPTGYTGVYGRIGAIIGPNPEDAGISVGLTAGYVSYRVAVSELVVRDDNDNLLGADRSQSHPDVGLGVFAYRYFNDYNLLYGGLSIPQVFGFDVTFQNDQGEFNIQRVRHYYANAGWYHFFSDESYIEVSTWVKYVDGAPVNADLNFRYQLPTAPFLGVGFSSGQNLHLEAGVNIGQATRSDSNFRLGYGFDYSLNSFSPSLGPTHEIQLAVSLNR